MTASHGLEPAAPGPADCAPAAFTSATLGLARVVHEAEVDSTMDVAHALAEGGAPSGTLVIADRQRAGRGRGGKAWQSGAGDGLWCTLLERDVAPDALAVLSLRVGLAVADTVAPWCDGRVGLKWPNDVLVADAAAPPVGSAMPRKLAGVLVEARWRDGAVDWVAIGLGLNLRVPAAAPAGVRAAALRPGTARGDVLRALVPRLRAAARLTGTLSDAERAAWEERDLVRGRASVSPARGVVCGIDATGALQVATPEGLVACRSGSLTLLEEDDAC